MFRVEDKNALAQQAQLVETNYVIQKNDFLQLEVFTNQGEKIIDPNQELSKQTTGSVAVPVKTYLVDIHGIVKFPLISELKLEGLTIRQAEEILQQEFAKFYKGCFVVLKFTNKRVVVLGVNGQVIPLVNENTRLTEVLATAKAITNESKAHNIRILRGETVYLADLTTINGYLKSDMIMQPGDIIYVEPVRRPFSEGFREYGPIISMITSLGTLVLVIIQLNKP